MKPLNSNSKNYLFLIILLLAVVFGGLTGSYFPSTTSILQPFGDIFLNLILTAVVPLIFFNVSSAVFKLTTNGKLKKLSFTMIIVFLCTSLIAAGFTILMMKFLPVMNTDGIQIPAVANHKQVASSIKFSQIFTVSDFNHLFSSQHILALIIFSIVFGLSCSKMESKSSFQYFLEMGEAVFMKFFNLIMFLAPVGFFAYFAVLMAKIGPLLMSNYLSISFYYYLFGLIYCVCGLTIYAYFSGKFAAVRLFWANITLPALTAMATCSSAATIPSNLDSARKMNIKAEIYEVLIPLGTVLHKDGTVIGALFKIVFLFSLFHWNFSGFAILIPAIGVALLVGSVMGAIPSGGMLGELLILAVYGFPQEMLITIAAISIIIDPLATLINVCSNNVCNLLTSRILLGKNWLSNRRKTNESTFKTL